MVTSVSSATTAASTATSSSSASLSADYDTFLQLLCAQLENQDPLDPTDTSEFTSQLVQYSSLEQQINTNDKLDSVLNTLNSSSLSSGVGYLGHSVEAAGNQVTVQDDGTVDAAWIYDLDAKASSVKLTVTDSDGNTVWSGTGDSGAGRHTLDWDGTDSNGNVVSDGTYTLSVSAIDSAGNDVGVTTSIRGTVTGVNSTSGSTVVELGGTSVALDDVTRVAN